MFSVCVPEPALPATIAAPPFALDNVAIEDVELYDMTPEPAPPATTAAPPTVNDTVIVDDDAPVKM